MARVTRIGVLVLAGLVAFGPMSLPVRAEQAGAGQVAALTQDLRALTEAMQIHDVLAIMQAEGQDYGKQLRDEMFPGKGGAEWQATVTRIYDPARMHEEFTARLAKELAVKPGVASAAADFFASETGRKIIGLELEARRALLDPVIEETARKAFEKMEAENSPRLEALRRFAKVNDLIEMNVMGALNANFAFYQGMASGGALGGEMSEEDMLSEVWSQEEQVRSDAEDWLWPYLALAYQPLSDEELQAYQSFSESPAGRDLNAALFAAFDTSFVRISRELGRATALMVQGQDI